MRELLILGVAAFAGFMLFRPKSASAAPRISSGPEAPVFLTYPARPFYSVGESWLGGEAGRLIETPIGAGRVRPDGLIETASGALLT